MTKKTKKSDEKRAFALQPVMVQSGRKNKITAFLTDSFFTGIYLAAVSVWLILSLELPVSTGACLILLTIPALLQQAVFGENAGKKGIRILIWYVVLAILAVVFYDLWISGIHLVCNYAVDAIGNRFPYLFPAYAVLVETEMEAAALYLAIGWILFFLAPAGGYLIRSGNRILTGLHIVILLLLWGLAGIGPGLPGGAVSLLGLLAVWIRGHSERIPLGWQNLASLEMSVLTAFAAAVLLVGGSLLAGRVLPEDGTVFAGWKASLEEMADGIRYQGDSQILPDGNFSGLTSFQPEQTPVLKITMSQPESYYLRGFTGSSYTGTGWEENDPEFLWKSRDLFYWLHEDGFYGQEILGNAALALGENTENEQRNVIEIENLAGSSGYCYVPYELQAVPGESIRRDQDGQKIGDAGVTAEGWRGERTYSYQALSNQIIKSPAYAAALLDETNLSESGKTYQKLEGYYNEYAYSAYLEIPDQLKQSLFSLLGACEIKDGEKHADYAEAKQNILYVLTSEYTDSNELEEAWDGADFIYEFLEISKQGYSVHFASAAVMMFRYYGIPARYVEGYLVTPEDAEAMTAGEAYILDETHAHAWVEYYQDGVGWLPFETTPSYLNTMEKPDEYQDISGISGESPEDQEEPEEEDEEEEEEEQEEHKIDWLLVAIVALLVGILLLLLTLLAFLIWLLIQRRKSKKLKKLFDSPDQREAVCALYEYTMNILSAAGLRIRNVSLYRYEKPLRKMFDEETAQEYREVVSIRQEAVYSTHEITEEQKEKLVHFKDKIWNRIYAGGSVMQKIQMKYIYFL